MDEEKFDEIMRKALAPEIGDDEIKFLRKTEVRTMKKMSIIRPVIAVAACAALVLGVSKIPDLQAVKNASDHPADSVAEHLENAFTLKVMAAERSKDGKTGEKEITKEQAVPVIPSVVSDGGIWCGDPTTKMKTVSYFEECPLVCEGTNIQKITYSINKGAFEVLSPKDSGYVLDGKKCSPLNVGWSGPKGFREGVDHDDFYTSYTVSPDFQTSEKVLVAICNVCGVSEDTYQKLWDFDRTLEDAKEGREEAYDGLTITCEVTYKDGSKETVQVAVGAAIMTPEEAGFEFEAPEKNGKSVYTTFQMK